MSKTILIVDDSGYSRSTIKGILVNAGYQVIGEAKDGVEALDKIVELDPDLVTLDNILPDMTGLEILRALKEQGISRTVIMVSAVGQQSAIQEGLDLGIKAYITKPFDPKELLDEVKKSFAISD